MKKTAFAQMVDRMCKLHPACKDNHETRLTFCEEFLRTVKKMQGTDLEPYLAEMICIPNEGCFKLSFKIPLVPYNKSNDLR